MKVQPRFELDISALQIIIEHVQINLSQNLLVQKAVFVTFNKKNELI